MNLDKYITTVMDYPQEGIAFKDITPLMANGEAYSFVVEEITKLARELEVDVIVGPEARGFIVGCPVAYNLKCGFVPVRKPGKLPREVLEANYELEYGTDTLTMHIGDIKPGQKVLICDDLLATGGTMSATIDLVEKAGGIVVGLAFIIELTFLHGRQRLQEQNIHSLIKY